MWIPIALILGLLLATAVIAHVSDTLGKRLGKKRVSVFGLRPRHSATVLTIASSWGIMGLTMVVLLGVYAPLKNAIFYYESESAGYIRDSRRAKAEIALAEAKLQATKASLALVNSKLDTTTDKLQSARIGEQSARNAVRAAQQQQRDAVATLYSAQNALRVSQVQLKSTKGDLAKRQSQVAQARSQVAQAQSRLSQANVELADRQLKVKAAQDQLKTAITAKIQADAAALRSQQAAYRTSQAAYRAGRRALQDYQKQASDFQQKIGVLQTETNDLQTQKKALQTEAEQLRINNERALDAYTHQSADAANLYQVAVGDIRLPVDQTLAERRLDAEQDPEQIEKELRYLMENSQEATRSFLPEATVVANSTITDPDKGGQLELNEAQTIQFYAERLALINKPVSARLVSAFNYPLGEKMVRARFVFVPIRTVYAVRENITEGVIEANKSEAAVFGQLNKLVDSARFNAIKRGASPPLSPDEQNFFDGDTGQKMFDALRQVQKMGHPVPVRIVAARDLDSAEPLQVRFVVGEQA